MPSIDKDLKRFNAAQENYNLFRSLHQEAYDFVAPQQETFRFHSPGQEKNIHVFDSTAVTGLQTFVSRIKGSTLPSWKQWIKLTSGQSIPKDERDSVNQDLEEGTEVFFNALNHSNFDSEINCSLVDMGIGTGAIIIDSGEFNSGDLLRFTHVPLSELYLEKPSQGRIRAGWRKQKVLIGEIAALWPDADITDKMQKALDKDANAEIEILNGQTYDYKTRKYRNVVIYPEEKHYIFEQEFDTPRLIIFRWSVVPGEVYGRGIAMQELPDIRTLNKVVEYKLKSLALSVGGIYTAVNDGNFNPNTVRLSPNTVIPVSSNNSANPTLSPLPTGGDPARVEIAIRELQDKISKAFFSNPLGDMSDPVRSATENMIRMQEMLKEAGASFGRLKSELIEPLIESAIDILAENGEFPKIRVDGQNVTIKHTSPLAQAEDLEEFNGIQQWAQSNIAIVGPEVFMGTAKVEDFPAETAKLLGVSPNLVRTKEEKEVIGKAVSQAAQSQIEGGPVDGAV